MSHHCFDPVHLPCTDSATTTDLAHRLDGLLGADPACLDGQAIIRGLRQADRAFDALYERLRTGGPLPTGWHPCDARAWRRGHSTAWLDSLSETLRHVQEARPTPAACLRAASVAWFALDAAMRDGDPLPDPWDNRRR